MSNTTSPLPAMGFTQMMIRALLRQMLPENLAVRPLTTVQIQRYGKAIRWLREHESALDAAHVKNGDEFQKLMAEWTEVLVPPEIPAWVYPAGWLVYGALIFFALPYLIRRIYPAIAKATIINTGLRFTFLSLRLYFTFRSRILDHFGMARTHSQSFINGIGEGFGAVLAVGATAFRAAPLAEAWPGLTGKERVQPNGQRTLILVLVAIAATILDIELPYAMIPTEGPQLVRGESTLSKVFAGVFALLRALGILTSWPLNQLGVRGCHRLASRLGYRRTDKHSIIRGFTDQLLATYRIPNPARDQELQLDAALAAQVVNT